MADLKPCPNRSCDFESVSLTFDTLPPREREEIWHMVHYVECGSCEMRGPLNDDKDSAVRLWNDLPRGATPGEREGGGRG